MDNKIIGNFLLTSTSCVVSSNYAQTSGGFLYVSQTALSTVNSINANLISGNKANDGYGGVLYLSSSTSN